MIFAYPALDFNFTSWMSPTNLRVLRTEQSEVHIPGIMHGKDHMRHKSPLSVVDDVPHQRRTKQQTWGQAFGKLAMSPLAEKRDKNPLSPAAKGRTKSLPRAMSTKVINWLAPDLLQNDEGETFMDDNNASEPSDSDDDNETIKDGRSDADKSLRQRVKTPKAEQAGFELPPMADVSVIAGVETDLVETGEVKKRKKAPIGTRLTMTSRVGYFQDRIISPSMVGRSPIRRRFANQHRCVLWQSYTLARGAIQISRQITTYRQSFPHHTCLRISRLSTSFVAREILLSTIQSSLLARSAKQSEPGEHRPRQP